MTHTTPSTSAQGPVAAVDVADEMRHYMQSGDKVPPEVIARWRGLLNKLDRLTASPSPSPSEVRVKPLEWIDLSDSCIAHTPFGVYKVAQAGETVNMFIARSELPKSFHTTLDEAKAAAQADYEARTRSALVSGSREDG